MTIRIRLALALTLAASTSAAYAHDKENWPTKLTFSDGTELAATLNYAYDVNAFSGDDGFGTPATHLEDATGVRRTEFGFTLKNKGLFDIIVYRDFHTDSWLDVALRVQSKPLFGRDLGALRIGYIKTPVGFEALTSSRAGSMMELSAATQAIFEGRRSGVEWSIDRDRYNLTLSRFFADNLGAGAVGTTTAARAIWTPVKDKAGVLHLGLAGSVENPDSDSARFSARPEAGLTTVRLVNSGALPGTDRIVRTGLEAYWQAGPWSLQGEYLQATSERNVQSDYTARGFYATGSWVATGESRPYNAGNVGNVKPSRLWGAVELLARYSELDLDDAGIVGGRQRDLTLGANWYLTTHFKFQANYVRLAVDKGLQSADSNVFELRGQVNF